MTAHVQNAGLLSSGPCSSCCLALLSSDQGFVSVHSPDHLRNTFEAMTKWSWFARCSAQFVNVDRRRKDFQHADLPSHPKMGNYNIANYRRYRRTGTRRTELSLRDFVVRQLEAGTEASVPGSK